MDPRCRANRVPRAVADEAAGPLPHPAIPLGEVTLTVARNERSLFAELASDMPIADRIHIIMAFVREENAGGGVLRDAGDPTAREALFQRASGFEPPMSACGVSPTGRWLTAWSGMCARSRRGHRT